MLKDATIVFDLDGTLVDTAPDLTNALNDVLTRHGHAAVSAEAVRASVGLGARVMIEEALRRAGVADDVDGMLAEFLIHYETNIARESRPFPGAVAALEALASGGARLVVCTNKREYLSRRLLQALELEGYFSAIAGRDTFAVAKPDPGHLTGVGRCQDGQSRERAGHPRGFGYAASPLDGLDPDAMIDHFDALQGCATSLLKAVGVRHFRS
jgi:phosphoglycolate phosphatase